MLAIRLFTEWLLMPSPVNVVGADTCICIKQTNNKQTNKQTTGLIFSEALKLAFAPVHQQDKTTAGLVLSGTQTERERERESNG